MIFCDLIFDLQALKSHMLTICVLDMNFLHHKMDM